MVCREPGLMVRLEKWDFFERPLPLAQLMLSLSMDTVATVQHTYVIHTFLILVLLREVEQIRARKWVTVGTAVVKFEMLVLVQSLKLRNVEFG